MEESEKKEVKIGLPNLEKAIEELPDYMQEGVREYIWGGRPLGDFLLAVFSNDLLRSFQRADFVNQSRLLLYARILHNAPLQCWGSEEKVQAWITRGGLEGIANGEQETTQGACNLEEE